MGHMSSLLDYHNTPSDPSNPRAWREYDSYCMRVHFLAFCAVSCGAILAWQEYAFCRVALHCVATGVNPRRSHSTGGSMPEASDSPGPQSSDFGFTRLQLGRCCRGCSYQLARSAVAGVGRLSDCSYGCAAADGIVKADTRVAAWDF
jgi:hypothetical protein